jgi:hypothetical protein
MVTRSPSIRATERARNAADQGIEIALYLAGCSPIRLLFDYGILKFLRRLRNCWPVEDAGGACEFVGAGLKLRQGAA